MKRNEVKVKLNIIETYEVPRVIEVTMTPQQYKNYENEECGLDKILRKSHNILEVKQNSSELTTKERGFLKLETSSFVKDIKLSKCNNMDILYSNTEVEEIEYE
jgi:hypothetical protein